LEPETWFSALLLEEAGGADFKSEEKMCEANAYLVKEGKEELVLEDISILRPEEEELYLQNIFGEQKRIKARIKEMNLIDHRIILEESR
jgi:predicted RNA-binding protein